ncbi:MAG: hypothetical protein HQK72_11710 [Desulfamplus sp.]|nr:hypothetical protein [Desulfamplus sp.]
MAGFAINPESGYEYLGVFINKVLKQPEQSHEIVKGRDEMTNISHDFSEYKISCD